MAPQFIQQMLEAGGCVDLNAKGYAAAFLTQWAQLAHQYGGHLTLRGLDLNTDALIALASAGRAHVTLVIEK
jgi:hypothetical protein